MRQGRIGVRQPNQLGSGQQSLILEFGMAALIAIGVFLAAIIVLNIVEFGRPD